MILMEPTNTPTGQRHAILLRTHRVLVDRKYDPSEDDDWCEDAWQDAQYDAAWQDHEWIGTSDSAWQTYVSDRKV